jgi:hypothetical protein
MGGVAVHVVPPVFCSRERRSAPGAATRYQHRVGTDG